MIPDPLLFTFSMFDTGALLFLLVYFVSFSKNKTKHKTIILLLLNC